MAPSCCQIRVGIQVFHITSVDAWDAGVMPLIIVEWGYTFRLPNRPLLILLCLRKPEYIVTIPHINSTDSRMGRDGGGV